MSISTTKCFEFASNEHDFASLFMSSELVNTTFVNPLYRQQIRRGSRACCCCCSTQCHGNIVPATISSNKPEFSVDCTHTATLEGNARNKRHEYQQLRNAAHAKNDRSDTSPVTVPRRMSFTEESFKRNLHKKMRGLKEKTIGECDVILVFCPIVSRAGTDIDAALERLDSVQVAKPVILVVLHHTFDIEKVIPDSNRIVNRQQILAVDCLFNEDEGLLQCQRNNDALDKITKHLQSQKVTSYACFKKSYASPHPSLFQDAEKVSNLRAVLGNCCCVQSSTVSNDD